MQQFNYYYDKVRIELEASKAELEKKESKGGNKKGAEKKNAIENYDFGKYEQSALEERISSKVSDEMKNRYVRPLVHQDGLLKKQKASMGFLQDLKRIAETVEGNKVSDLGAHPPFPQQSQSVYPTPRSPGEFSSLPSPYLPGMGYDLAGLRSTTTMSFNKEIKLDDPSKLPRLSALISPHSQASTQFPGMLEQGKKVKELGKDGKKLEEVPGEQAPVYEVDEVKAKIYHHGIRSMNDEEPDVVRRGVATRGGAGGANGDNTGKITYNNKRKMYQDKYGGFLPVDTDSKINDLMTELLHKQNVFTKNVQKFAHKK